MLDLLIGNSWLVFIGWCRSYRWWVQILSMSHPRNPIKIRTKIDFFEVAPGLEWLHSTSFGVTSVAVAGISNTDNIYRGKILKKEYFYIFIAEILNFSYDIKSLKFCGNRHKIFEILWKRMRITDFLCVENHTGKTSFVNVIVHWENVYFLIQRCGTCYIRICWRVAELILMTLCERGTEWAAIITSNKDNTRRGSIHALTGIRNRAQLWETQSLTTQQLSGTERI